MASFSKVSELAARKRAVVAECEAYRQMLTADVEQIREYRRSFRRKFGFLRISRLLLVLVPAGLTIFGLKSRSRKLPVETAGWKRWLSTALIGWRLYRKFSPALGPILAQLRSRRPASRHSEWVSRRE